MLKLMTAAALSLAATPVLAQTTTENLVRSAEPVCQIGFREGPEALARAIREMKSPEAREAFTLMCVMYVKGATYQKRRVAR